MIKHDNIWIDKNVVCFLHHKNIPLNKLYLSPMSAKPLIYVLSNTSPCLRLCNSNASHVHACTYTYHILPLNSHGYHKFQVEIGAMTN